MTFRFAPSPNGHLHLGHAYSALLNRRMAHEADAPCLLRIEDIDPVRCTPALEREMLEDLAWIGFEPDGTPMRQSSRMDAYGAALEGLRRAGLVYPAFLSRAEIRQATAAAADWPRDPDGAPFYPRETLGPDEIAERLGRGDRHAWRLDMALATQAAGALDLEAGWGRPEDWGDPVLARSDVPTSYHLAVVVDDAAQGVTHVVRGVDLERATALHVLLQKLLGLPTPRYTHHRLLLDQDGRKLSKSNRSRTLRALRADGAGPDEVRRLVGLSL